MAASFQNSCNCVSQGHQPSKKAHADFKSNSRWYYEWTICHPFLKTIMHYHYRVFAVILLLTANFSANFKLKKVVIEGCWKIRSAKPWDWKLKCQYYPPLWNKGFWNICQTSWNKLHVSRFIQCFLEAHMHTHKMTQHNHRDKTKKRERKENNPQIIGKSVNQRKRFETKNILKAVKGGKQVGNQEYMFH